MMKYKGYSGYIQSERIQLEILMALDKINDNLARLSNITEQKQEEEKPVKKVRSKRGEE